MTTSAVFGCDTTAEIIQLHADLSMALILSMAMFSLLRLEKAIKDCAPSLAEPPTAIGAGR